MRFEPNIARTLACLIGLMLLSGCADIQTYESVDDPAYRPSLRAGNNGLRYIDGQLFYLYVPEAVLDDPAGSRILVAVHGYRGRLEGYRGGDVVRRGASRWASLAERNRWVVLAPQFDAARFDNDYQRLNLGGGLRADRRLHQLVDLVGALLPGVETERLLLFGFSGGGQFVHRYAMLHPGRVERAVAAGAGWYTFPDPQLPYPLGVAADSLPADLDFAADRFAEVSLLLLVGEADAAAGAFQRSLERDGRRYDLDELQGTTRAERARNWFDAIGRIDPGGDSKLRFEQLPGTGHRISATMRDFAARFLSD